MTIPIITDFSHSLILTSIEKLTELRERSKRRRAKKIRNAFLERFCLNFLIFLSLNYIYVSGFPFGSRKSPAMTSGVTPFFTMRKPYFRQHAGPA